MGLGFPSKELRDFLWLIGGDFNTKILRKELRHEENFILGQGFMIPREEHLISLTKRMQDKVTVNFRMKGFWTLICADLRR